MPSSESRADRHTLRRAKTYSISALHSLPSAQSIVSEETAWDCRDFATLEECEATDGCNGQRRTQKMLREIHVSAPDVAQVHFVYLVKGKDMSDHEHVRYSS